MGRFKATGYGADNRDLAASVAGGEAVDEAVCLQETDHDWRRKFEAEAARVARAIRVPWTTFQHIGSTAVPDLLAKPIIDMMVTLPSLPPSDSLIRKIEQLGYESMGEAGVPGRYYFRKRGEGQAYNLHVVVEGSNLLFQATALRDYLSSNVDARRRYANEKQVAIRNGAQRLLAYSAAKAEIVEELTRDALRWMRDSQFDVEANRIPGPVAVRIASPEDGEAVAAIYGPVVRDTCISFETEPPSGDVMAERIRSTLPSHPYLVAARAGEVVGYAYASKHRERAAYRWSVDVTVYVAPHAHRTGVGRALYGPLLSILRAQGFHSAFAGIALPNPGSVGLHEAMGFAPVGIYRNVGFKHGKWHSVGWWGLELVEIVETPAEPLPLSSIDLTIQPFRAG